MKNGICAFILFFLVSSPIYGSLSVWSRQERVIIENYSRAFTESDQGHFDSTEYQNAIKEIEKTILLGEYINQKIEIPSPALSAYPIHWAVAVGDVSHVTFLIEHGANLNTTDSKGRTPLHTVISMGQKRIEKKDPIALKRYIQVGKKLLENQICPKEHLPRLLPLPELFEEVAKTLPQDQLDELLSLSCSIILNKGSMPEEFLSRLSQSKEILLKLGAKSTSKTIDVK